MGEVWLAEHAMLGRRAAIKVLHTEFSSRPEIVTRFFNEARAATAISDPGIVQIFDFGHHSDGFVDNAGTDFAENCDPGSAGETSTCNANCTTPRCGDEIVNQHFKPDGVHGEQCDNGVSNSDHSDCTADCQVNVCGDGKVDTAGPIHLEQCDDGNKVNNDGCDVACELPTCGNGIVDEGEQCDDGNATNGDGCSTLCKYD